MLNKTIHKADSRGYFDYGWLRTYHSFSFSNYFNPEKMNFGKLRVLNDDIISPLEGFPLHPHQNMEIITVPLKGELKHTDSTGSVEIIKEGDVQVMSAGTGILHSEYSNSPKVNVNLLQIWIMPDELDIAPRYDQKNFDWKNKSNKLHLVASPKKDNGSLWINQQAYISVGRFDSGKELRYKLYMPYNSIYIFIIEGATDIEGEKLNKRDAIGLINVNKININYDSELEIIIIEVPS